MGTSLGCVYLLKHDDDLDVFRAEAPKTCRLAFWLAFPTKFLLGTNKVKTYPRSGGTVIGAYFFIQIDYYYIISNDIKVADAVRLSGSVSAEESNRLFQWNFPLDGIISLINISFRFFVLSIHLNFFPRSLYSFLASAFFPRIEILNYGWRKREAHFGFVFRSAVAPIRQPVLLLFARCEMEESLEWPGRLERCASSSVFAHRTAIEVFHQMITFFCPPPPPPLPLLGSASVINDLKKRNYRRNHGYQSLDSFYCRYEYCFSFSASEFSFESSCRLMCACMRWISRRGNEANVSFIQNSVRDANMEILDEYRLLEEYAPTGSQKLQPFTGRWWRLPLQLIVSQIEAQITFD